MKNILLTGSEGYIATNFKSLYKDYYNFIELDKQIGKPVLNYNKFDTDNINCIVHLAAISGIQNCEEDKNQTIIDNVSSSLYLFKKSFKYKIPLIFASSQGAKTPDNLYSITKNICDKEIISYNLENPLFFSLRFANVYGGINYLKTKTSVVSKFINAKINGDFLKIHGDGSQIRDFIHVNDICKIINLIIDKNLKSVYPIDVGTGVGISIEQLANMIGGFKHYTKSRQIGVQSNIANTDSLNKIFNFVPDHNNLFKYINYFQF